MQGAAQNRLCQPCSGQLVRDGQLGWLSPSGQHPPITTYTSRLHIVSQLQLSGPCMQTFHLCSTWLHFCSSSQRWNNQGLLSVSMAATTVASPLSGCLGLIPQSPITHYTTAGSKRKAVLQSLRYAHPQPRAAASAGSTPHNRGISVKRRSNEKQSGALQVRSYTSTLVCLSPWYSDKDYANNCFFILGP